MSRRAAIILAGGRSSRMGRPKAWLPFEEVPLLTHLLRRLESHFDELIVVAAPGMELPPSGAARLEDEWPGEGPLGGMVTGLSACRAPVAFVASCDLPLLDAEVASRMCDLLEPDFEAVTPLIEGRYHPLHAAYRTAPAAREGRELMVAGVRRPVALYPRLRTRELSDDYSRLDPRLRSLRNMNSPSDYQEAIDEWRAENL